MTVLNALIREYGSRSTVYGPPGFPLSDHLPMAATALAEMGASKERCAAWAARHAAEKQLRPADAEELAVRARWRSRIREHGARTTVRTALRESADALGTAAFHAVIRAAYAVERQDDDDLATALASLERERLPLPMPASTHTVSVAEALDAARTVEHDGTDRGLITTAMAATAASPAFADAVARQPDPTSLPLILTASATMFAATGNFTVLHLLTGSHAVRVLTAFADLEAVVWTGYWSAYVAALSSTNVTPATSLASADALREAAPPAWEPLLAAAIASDDDHVIKSTYTAWRLDRELDDPIFRTAAANYHARVRG